MQTRFPNGLQIAGYLLLFKTTYFALLTAGLLLWPGPNENPYSNRPSSTSLKSRFSATDGRAYLLLSREGYKQSTAECAFYPLYPLSIRWASAITGCDDVLVAIVLSNLFSTAAFVFFFKVAARRFGETAAVLALALLLAFPGSLFFQFIYTESLFLLLLMLLLLGLDENHCGMALAAAFLLPLTRAVGIFCVFPLLWHVLFTPPPAWWLGLARRSGWVGPIMRFIGPRGADSSILTWRGAQSVLLVMAPLLGWLTYFLLMWKWTGNPFEGMDAQKQFGGVQSIHHLFEPIRFVTQLFSPTEWHAFRGSLLDRCVFILLIYCLPLIWKLDKSWCIWAFFLGVVPAVSGGFTSYTRFASVVFPLFIALGVFLSKPGRWCRCLVLATFAILHLVLVWRFVNFKWAG
jgi:hypothetical protein